MANLQEREINVQRTKKTKGDNPEKIVFANGVFDLLHPGHIKLLKFAKSLGGKLIVGINSDRAAKLLKGAGRPLHTEQSRKAALEDLDFVDEVVIFDDLRTTAIIRHIKPDVVVKGAEYTVEQVRKDDIVPPDIDIVLCPIATDRKGDKISTTKLTSEELHLAPSLTLS